MSDANEAFGLPLYHLRPPYAGFGPPLRHAELARERFGPGSLLAVGIAAPGEAWPELAAWVPRIRAEHPAVPALLRLEGDDAGAALRLAHRAAALGVRAAIAGEAPVEPTLRAALAEPVDLAADVVEWLALRGTPLGPRVCDLALRIVRNAGDARTLGDLLAELGVPERTARAACRKKRLPPPCAWFDLARGLATALRVQREAKAPLWALALEAGYADHSGLCKHMRRLFRARAQEIRGNLGWEWMMDRWAAARLPQARLAPGRLRVPMGPRAAIQVALAT